jgi:serine/threonine protein kinase
VAERECAAARRWPRMAQNPSAGGAPPGPATGTPPPATRAPTLPVVAWDPSWLTAPLLGSGSFGDVRAGMVRPYGPVAIKLPREFGSEQAFRDEASALAAGGGGHANVVQVYAIAIEPVDRPHVAILMRRWKTTLHAVLHREGGRALSALQREAVAFQLASGLVALHAANVLHRDVKSGNALLNINPDECGGVQACWSDFGLAHVGAISTVRTQRAMGSLGYMAPEIADAPEGSVIPYRAAADVFAFGVVIAELVSGKAPAWSGGTGFSFLAPWVRDRGYRAADCANQDVFGSHRLVAELLLTWSRAPPRRSSRRGLSCRRSRPRSSGTRALGRRYTPPARGQT